MKARVNHTRIMMDALAITIRTRVLAVITRATAQEPMGQHVAEQPHVVELMIRQIAIMNQGVIGLRRLLLHFRILQPVQIAIIGFTMQIAVMPML